MPSSTSSCVSARHSNGASRVISWRRKSRGTSQAMSCRRASATLPDRSAHWPSRPMQAAPCAHSPKPCRTKMLDNEGPVRHSSVMKKKNDEDLGRTSGLHLSGTNLERAGDHNQRVTLHAIRVNGPITRTDLANITGLTPPAIANITKRLMQDNLIREAGRVRGARGQPPLKLVINPDSWFSVGVNVDRDHMTIVVLDFQGTVRARSSREIQFALPGTVQSFFQRSIGHLLEKASIGAAQLAGIGVAFPDDIQQAELPDQPAAYSAWGSVAVQQLFAAPLKVPVFVENDAAAAAMGEMQFGRGHQYQSFFYILITAALGGGLVIDGQYFRGANGRSAELGWIRAHDG